jgi:hypothetical protein
MTGHWRSRARSPTMVSSCHRLVNQQPEVTNEPACQCPCRASAIGALTDEQLDRAATVSLYADAPLTCQFMLEDHAVRHSCHHLL